MGDYCAPETREDPTVQLVKTDALAGVAPEASIKTGDLGHTPNGWQIKSEYESALASIQIAAEMAARDRQIEEDDEEILLLL